MLRYFRAVVIAVAFISAAFAAEPAPTIPAPAPRIATGSWATALQQHPRLFGSKEYLRGLATSKPEEYRRLKQLHELIPVGVVNAVEGVPFKDANAFIQKAMQRVAHGVTNVHQDTWIGLEEVAVTYDLFYDQISPADRAKIIAWFNAHLGKFTIDENAFHNSTLSKIMCYLRIAYATWGENPQAPAFRDYAIQKLYEGKVLPVLKQFGAGGGFTECGWYSRHALWHLVQGLETARRFEKYDGFALAPAFFYQRLAYELFQPYPGLWTYGTEQYPLEGDGSNIYGGHTEYPRHMRTVLAQYFRGSELAGYTASKKRKPSNPQSGVTDFLYDEPADPAWPLATAPLAHIAQGIGKVYARSDWTDQATWFRFDCGSYWTAHQHFEVGNFEIFRYEPLATESGEYTEWGDAHAMNWLIRTVAHNCILVYQPGEQWKQMRDGGKMAYANDGGQAKTWDWPADDIQQWNAHREQFTRGQIIAYENRPEWMYIAADCTKAYSPQKLSRWIRQIVFLRPGTFVIVDRVTSTKAEYPKAWLFHCKNEPELSGAKSVIRNGQGQLDVQTLLPADAKISKIHGYQYPAFAGGQTYPAPQSGLTAAANLWRIEVSPSTPATDDLFVHLLSTDGPHEAKCRADGTNVIVQVGDATIALAAPSGGELTINGQRQPLPTSVVAGKWE
jgi:hypothetical protein